MKNSRTWQTVAAVACILGAVLQHDEVLGALGLWLAPSAVTLLRAVGAALRKVGRG